MVLISILGAFAGVAMRTLNKTNLKPSIAEVFKIEGSPTTFLALAKDELRTCGLCVLKQFPSWCDACKCDPKDRDGKRGIIVVRKL
jgi:hypothetical protein